MSTTERFKCLVVLVCFVMSGACVAQRIVETFNINQTVDMFTLDFSNPNIFYGANYHDQFYRRIYAVDMQAKKVMWNRRFLGLQKNTPLLSTTDLVICRLAGGVYAFAKTTGNLVWGFNQSTTLDVPLAHGLANFKSKIIEVVHVVEIDQNWAVTALSVESGDQVWSYKLPFHDEAADYGFLYANLNTTGVVYQQLYSLQNREFQLHSFDGDGTLLAQAPIQTNNLVTLTKSFLVIIITPGLPNTVTAYDAKNKFKQSWTLAPPKDSVFSLYQSVNNIPYTDLVYIQIGPYTPFVNNPRNSLVLYDTIKTRVVWNNTAVNTLVASLRTNTKVFVGKDSNAYYGYNTSFAGDAQTLVPISHLTGKSMSKPIQISEDFEIFEGANSQSQIITAFNINSVHWNTTISVISYN